MPFICPVCSCPEYQRIVIPRERGDPYATEFFCCLGCSLMFVEPELFAAAHDQARARTVTGAADVSMRSQEIRARFWKARAKRENGGLEPTLEQITRLRDRYRQ